MLRESLLITIILFLICIPHFAQESQPDSAWTLEMCIDHALEKNIQVRQSVLSNTSDQIGIERAKGQRFPTLDLNIRQDQSWSNQENLETGESAFKGSASTNYSVSSVITLFNGFSISNRIRQAELDFESSRYYSEAIRESISLNVLNAFLAVLFADEQVKNSSQQIEATKEQLFLAEQRLSLQAISRSDYLQVKSQLASEKLNLANAISQLSVSKVNLMQLMELPVSKYFKLVNPQLDSSLNQSLEPDPEEIFGIAVGIKPQIKNAELNKESAVYEEKIVRAGYIPSLAMSAGFGTGYLSLDPNTGYFHQLGDRANPSVALTLSVPILQRNQVKTSVSQAKISYQNAELNELDVRNQLRKEIEQACVDVTSAQTEYEASLEKYQSLMESNDLAEEKFRQGLINSVDYLFEKTNLIVAESQLLQAKFNLIFSYKVLDFFSGVPLTL